jgi:transcriptional regulator with XRE-family HTH domain
VAKKIDFSEIFDAASENSLVYQFEGIILEFTEAVVTRMMKDGITKVELARRMNTTPTQITRILNGQNITLLTATRIARALGCELAVRLKSHKRGGSR